MSTGRKTLWFVGTSLRDLRAFPAAARRTAGFELDLIQQGLDPTDWKPMSTVGSGVREIRVTIDGQFRVLYVARFKEAVYVLHAFRKKTQRTPQTELELARRRLADVMRDRPGKEQ